MQHKTETLKMHDLKMTDKENWGTGKRRTGKWPKKSNLLVDARIKACIASYDACSYTKLQFLRAMSPISHSLGIAARYTCRDDERRQRRQRRPAAAADRA